MIYSENNEVKIGINIDKKTSWQYKCASWVKYTQSLSTKKVISLEALQLNQTRILQ
jgi:hypothetical protein